MVAYGAFLRLMKTLLYLWQKEVGDEPLYCPPNYFYDKTFVYSHCDRVGGLEVRFIDIRIMDIQNLLTQCNYILLSAQSCTDLGLLN